MIVKIDTKVKFMEKIDTILPGQIRKTKEQVARERRVIKKNLRAQLTDRGDIAHIHKLLNQGAPINYASVTYALNPNHSLWSPRVIEFTQQYLATRDAVRNGQDEL